MLEQEDSLPRPERQAPILDWYRQLGLCQRRAQMRRHVVGAFLVMLVRAAFRRQSREIGFQVAPGRGRGILLDDQRSRCVLAEEGEEAVANGSRSDPIGHV